MNSSEGNRRNHTRLSRVEGAALAAMALLIGLLAVKGMPVGHVANGDSQVLVEGASEILECISDGIRQACALGEKGRSHIGPFPLLQYLPATLLVWLGLDGGQALQALALSNLLAITSVLVAIWFGLRQDSRYAWVAPLVVAVLISGPFSYYSTTAFGEMLSSSMLLAAALAAYRRSPGLVLIFSVLATISKETLAPFVGLIIAVALLLSAESRGTTRRTVALTGTAGIALGLAANLLFNLFRFGTMENLTYLQPLFRVPRSSLALGHFGLVIASPSSGLAWHWPLAILVVSGSVLAGLIALRREPRSVEAWLPLTLVGAIYVGFAGAISFWYSPFGWIAWGPRLMVPIMPALVLLGLLALATKTELLGWLRRQGRWVPAVVTAIAVAVALPQWSGPWTYGAVLARLVEPDHVCDSIAVVTVQADPDEYFRCVSHVGSRFHPSWIDVAMTEGGQAAGLARLLGSVAIAALLFASYFRARTRDETSEFYDESTTPKQRKGLTAVVLLVVLAALSLANWDDLTEPRYEDGDFAANSILIDQALNLELVHGNYSRTGFYHPGPALLYVQAASQAVFYDLTRLLPTPYNAHLFGIFILNAALIAVAARITHRLTGSLWIAGSLIVTVFAYSHLLADPGLGGLIASTWMPNVYVWPFLLFIVSAASVGMGTRESIWALLLGGGLLIHGHIAFVLPVIVLGLVAGVGFARHHGRQPVLSVPPVRHAIVSTALTALFALPIVIQILSEFPGPIDDYLDYAARSNVPSRNVGEVASYVAYYWTGGRPAVVIGLAGIVAAFAAVRLSSRVRLSDFNRAMFLIGVIATLTTAVYAAIGVDDLRFTYLGLFYAAVPIAICAIMIGTILQYAAVDRPRMAGAAAVVLLAGTVTWLLMPASSSQYGGSSVGEAYSAIDARFPEKEALAISMTSHDRWVATIGILEQARRDQRRVCVYVDPGVFEVVFTSHTVCTGRQRAKELVVSETDTPPWPGAELIYAAPDYGVWLR